MIKVKSNRIGFKIRGKELKSFTDKSGWWESGDLGKKIRIKNKIYIEIIGRGDNAFSSGGEIIFPDIITERLKKFTVKNKLPFEKFIISKLEDKYWESKFEVIIQLKNNAEKNKIQSSLDLLKEYTEIWSKHERPSRWVVNSKKIQTENYIQNWKNMQI